MSTAQVFTAIGYNESTRNLDFRVKCESLNDLKQCVNIIRAYNEFDAERINEALDQHASKKAYYNEGNPNNGKDKYTFTVGREGSPVMYVELYAANDEEVKEFKSAMEYLSRKALADEFSIKEDKFAGSTMLQARLWWD